MFRTPTIAGLLLAGIWGNTKADAGERLAFNDGWRFQLGEEDSTSKPLPKDPRFNDSEWRPVQLPHDWAIEGPFSSEYNARCGGLPFHGVGWYRKTFTLPAQCKDKHVSIELDGAMAQSEVWLNGHKLGGRPYGYIGFSLDLTPHLHTPGSGAENVLAVRLAPEDLSSRWYPGAGIYRNVWLRVSGKLRVPQWGTYVTTRTLGNGSALVRVRTEIANGTPPLQFSVDHTLETTLIDAQGKTVAVAETQFSTEGDVPAMHQELTIEKPRLWDTDDPHLYTAVSRITLGETLIDRSETTFGVRTIAYDNEQGFQLNGRPIKFQGVCMHHDLGPLGGAVNRRATERQLEIMKSMGVNAIRTSHNPPSPEQLELCDELGLLVQVEAFDVWRLGKVENGYNVDYDAWHERDLRDMIRRDRNHPSVVMWSIGNEIREQSQPDGWQEARHLVGICHAEDPTRPVTAGFNIYPGAVKNGLADEVDLVGLNYKPAYYEEVIREHPHWIVYGSETASTVSSRGIYHFPFEKYTTHESLQVTSYDIINPPWAYPPDVEFHFIQENPTILGEFIWTGFDYLGEPTPYGGRDNSTNGYWNDSWPAHGSYFGAVDLCGFAKDRYYLYQSQWTDEPMVHLLPHWNWPEMQGKTIPVYCYTNCEEAELFLDGKSLGRQRKGENPVVLPVDFKGHEGDTFASKYRIQWEVPYQPGELKVVAYNDGKAAAEKVVQTAGRPAAIELEVDRPTVDADGQDLAFITARIVDAAGVPCPTADNDVRFRVSGTGRLESLGSGNPISIESFQADHRKAFSGKCLAIVRPGTEPGEIKIIAESDGLRGQAIEVQSR